MATDQENMDLVFSGATIVSHACHVLSHISNAFDATGNAKMAEILDGIVVKLSTAATQIRSGMGGYVHNQAKTSEDEVKDMLKMLLDKATEKES